MANLIVIAYDSEEVAEEAHKALVQGSKEGLVRIDDAAIVVKGADGKVQVKNQVARGTWISTGVGGLLGLLIAGIFFPVGGIVLGLAGGALVGRMMDLGIDGKFVKEVGEQIKPGNSALFILIGDAQSAGEIAILHKYPGKLIQTNLSYEAEQSLRRALGDEGGEKSWGDVGAADSSASTSAGNAA